MGTDFQGQKILLVDDDAGLLKLLTMRLQATGLEIETAESAEQAIATMPSYLPQVIISDLQMGDMDGLELFKYAQEHYPSVPFIILTAHGTIKQAVSATRQGLFGFLTKPYESAELLELIKRALSINNYQNHDQDFNNNDLRREVCIKRLSEIESQLQDVINNIQALKVIENNINKKPDTEFTNGN